MHGGGRSRPPERQTDKQTDGCSGDLKDLGLPPQEVPDGLFEVSNDRKGLSSCPYDDPRDFRIIDTTIIITTV